MEEYNVEDRLITKEDWENWLKLKEGYSDKCLSNMPETPIKKETKYAVIEWHKYPEEKPKTDDQYIVSIKLWNNSFTATANWRNVKDKFVDVFDRNITAWTEMPKPYKEET